MATRRKRQIRRPHRPLSLQPHVGLMATLTNCSSKRHTDQTPIEDSLCHLARRHDHQFVLTNLWAFMRYYTAGNGDLDLQDIEDLFIFLSPYLKECTRSMHAGRKAELLIAKLETVINNLVRKNKRDLYTCTLVHACLQEGDLVSALEANSLFNFTSNDIQLRRHVEFLRNVLRVLEQQKAGLTGSSEGSNLWDHVAGLMPNFGHCPLFDWAIPLHADCLLDKTVSAKILEEILLPRLKRQYDLQIHLFLLHWANLWHSFKVKHITGAHPLLQRVDRVFSHLESRYLTLDGEEDDVDDEAGDGVSGQPKRAMSVKIMIRLARQLSLSLISILENRQSLGPTQKHCHTHRLRLVCNILMDHLNQESLQAWFEKAFDRLRQAVLLQLLPSPEDLDPSEDKFLATFWNALYDGAQWMENPLALSRRQRWLALKNHVVSGPPGACAVRTIRHDNLRVLRYLPDLNQQILWKTTLLCRDAGLFFEYETVRKLHVALKLCHVAGLAPSISSDRDHLVSVRGLDAVRRLLEFDGANLKEDLQGPDSELQKQLVQLSKYSLSTVVYHRCATSQAKALGDALQELQRSGQARSRLPNLVQDLCAVLNGRTRPVSTVYKYVALLKHYINLQPALRRLDAIAARVHHVANQHGLSQDKVLDACRKLAHKLNTAFISLQAAINVCAAAFRSDEERLVQCLEQQFDDLFLS